MSEELMMRFRAAQERVIEAWAVLLDCHVTGQRGDGDQAYERASGELAALLRGAGVADEAGYEIQLCQVVGSLRAAHRWQNPPYSDIPGLPEFLRQRRPLIIGDEMLEPP
ncbi:hypothetical protein [Rhodopila sp.]|uniref:hypothetical protein n=1 Tax=Rhodopila sp. TaxID=2480087 RepID=UPI003D0EE078